MTTSAEPLTLKDPMSKVGYSSASVANELLNLASERGLNVTVLGLMKLVYIAHGWHLALTGKPLLAERVEAWKFGPVVNSLYHQFKYTAPRPIKRGERAFEEDNCLFLVPGSHSHQILDRVIEEYGDKSGGELVALTHTKGTPWYETWFGPRDGRLRPGTDIEDELIKSYYDRLRATRGK